eukprot:166521_1
MELLTSKFNDLDSNWIGLEGICHPLNTRNIQTDKTFYCMLYSNIVAINNKEFIILHNKNIYKYDTYTNKWNIWIENVPNVNCTSCNISYDTRKKYIYTTTDSGLNVIDTNSKPFETGTINTEAPRPCENTHSSLIVIDGICHVIGPQFNKFHCFWNNETNKIEVITAFTQPIIDELFSKHHNKKYIKIEVDEQLSEFGVVYASKTKHIYCLGGSRRGNQAETYHSILKYCIENNNWTELDVVLPHKEMEKFGCVITKDERYVIILGGSSGEQINEEWDALEYIDSQNIYVFDLYELKLSKSKVMMPFIIDWETFECAKDRICIMTERYLSILMENVLENSLLVHGFVKQSVELYYLNIPLGLINMICFYHTIEYIYVINSDDGSHWKINVDKIIETI